MLMVDDHAFLMMVCKYFIFLVLIIVIITFNHYYDYDYVGASFLLVHKSNYFLQLIKRSFSSIVGVSNTTTTTTTTTEVAVDWLDLPDHILLVVAEKLFIQIKDYIRFGAVCRSWRSLYTQHQHQHQYHHQTQLPLLMLPSSELLTINDQQTCCFYDILENKIYNNFLLPVPHQNYYCGSSHGWLISFTPTSPPVANLFNPFLSSSINLPPLTNFDYFIEEETDCHICCFLTKVVLSASPASNPNTCLVLAAFGSYCRLVFCKPNDDGWTSLELHPDSMNLPWQPYRPCSLTDDIIYFENKFYTVDAYGALWVIDLDDPLPRLSNLLPPLEALEPSRDLACKNYVVPSSGHLLQVRRIFPLLDDFSYSTTKFQVFKLDQAHRKRIETKNLCGQMLFLGHNASMSFTASDYPGCNANCIYFTDDYIEGYYESDDDIGACPGPPDMGVFNLEDGSIESHYQVRESRRFLPPPIWIEPTPQTVSKDG